jgi:hypothetical protein
MAMETVLGVNANHTVKELRRHLARTSTPNMTGLASGDTSIPTGLTFRTSFTTKPLWSCRRFGYYGRGRDSGSIESEVA